MKTKYVICFCMLIILINIVFISAAEGVYVLQKNEEGDLRPVLKPFVNGEIDFLEKDGYQTVYLEKSEDGKDGKNSLGGMKGVKLKKDGQNIIVEYGTGGSLSRPGPDSSSLEFANLNYDHIKTGGKIVLNSKSEIVSANFEITGSGKYYLNGFMYDMPISTRIDLANNIINLKLTQGGKFTYYSLKEPEKKKTYNGIKTGGEFSFNEKGELTKANFEVTLETDLDLKGYKYKLAANSKVNFDGNKVEITLPAGTKLSVPEKGADADPNFIFTFTTDLGGLALPNGDIIESKNGKTVINYKDGFYASNGKYAVKSNGGNEDYLMNVNKEVYLYSDNDKIDISKAYVLFGKDKLESFSPLGEGASLFVLPGNRLGIKVTADNTIAIQGKNGKAIIERPVNLDSPPEIKISGESILVLDKRSFYAKGNEYYFDPKNVLINDFNNGKYSASSKVSLVNDVGSNIKNFYVLSNDKDQYAAVSDSDLKSPFKYVKTAGNFFVSSSLTFNQLSYDSQKFYSSLGAKEQQEIASAASGGNMQVLMQKLIAEEIKIRQNPVKASVRVRGGGGSGTIIGVDQKDGKPIILTAGHLGGATSVGYRYNSIDLADGRTVSGTSLGGYSDYGGSGHDYALIKLDSVIDKVPYVPVADESHIVSSGDAAIRIGCPSCGPFKQTETRLGSIGNIIRHGSNEEIIGGESGGGLFHKGRVVGVVSTGGYYTGTNVIRDFLRKYGYGYLISFVRIFVDSNFIIN